MKRLRNLWSVLVWVYFMLTILSIVFIDMNIEKTAREQARYMANWIAQCINERVWSWTYSRAELSKISYECGSSHRSGWVTWDFFVVNLANNQFVYDGSPDCSKDWYDRHLSDKEECSLHKNKELCNKVISQLKQWHNSYEWQNLYWEFDDAKEWLEWVIIPSERKWYQWYIWEWWVRNKNNTQLLVVMWTQSDEVESQWIMPKIFLTLSLLLGVILIVSSYLLIQYERRDS